MARNGLCRSILKIPNEFWAKLEGPVCHPSLRLTQAILLARLFRAGHERKRSYLEACLCACTVEAVFPALFCQVRNHESEQLLGCGVLGDAEPQDKVLGLTLGQR